MRLPAAIRRSRHEPTSERLAAAVDASRSDEWPSIMHSKRGVKFDRLHSREALFRTSSIVANLSLGVASIDGPSGQLIDYLLCSPNGLRSRQSAYACAGDSRSLLISICSSSRDRKSNVSI